MKFPVYEILFFFFSTCLVLSSLVVVLTKNPVKSILFLILAFFASAILWMMLKSEFLALVLIFVYVGAVMTLFMFVVMMTHFNGIFVKGERKRTLPFAALLFVLLLALLSMALISGHLPQLQTSLHAFPASYNNTRSLGILLFTRYLYPFEVAGAILLVAMVAAITLAFHGHRQDAKRQILATQHEAKKSERLKIVKIKGDSE